MTPQTAVIARNEATKQSQREGGGESSVWLRPLVYEAVEFGGVVADDLLADGCGEVAELALDVFLRVGPYAVGVREIRAPHDVVLAEFVDEFDANWVALIGGVALAAPVFAGRHLQVELLELVLPLGVHALQDVGDPAGAGLADDELDAGVVFEHAREDHRQQYLRHIHLEARDPGGAGGERHFWCELCKIAPHTAADRMEMHRQSARRDR